MGGGGAWATSKPAEVDEDVETPAPKTTASPLYGAPAPPEPASRGFMSFQKSEDTNNIKSATSAFGAAPGGAFSNSAPGSSSAGATSSDIAAREEALRKKEAELAAKEKNLREREKDLESRGGGKKKNWPVCFPLLHHDIAGEIPEKSKRCVRTIYMAWWGLCWCLCYNFFAASVMLGYKDAGDRIASWFLAVIYMLLGVPLAFWSWYLRMYRAARDESTLGYIGFFICFLIHVGYCIWAAIAVPFSTERWSFAGWVTAMVAFDQDVFPGVVYIIGACFWTLESLLSLWCLKDSYLFFRGKGGVEQAKQEAAIEAFKAGFAQQPAK